MKAKAFQPQMNDRETSCFNINPQDRPVLWQHAIDHGRTGVPVLAAAVIVCGDIKRQGLKVEIAIPPPQHVVLRGWPFDGDEQLVLKSIRLDIQNKLAAAAELISP